MKFAFFLNAVDLDQSYLKGINHRYSEGFKCWVLLSSALYFLVVDYLISLVFAYIKCYNMIIGKKVFLCGKNIFQNINGRIYFGFYLLFWHASWWVMILFFRLLIKKSLIMGAYLELHLHYITCYLLISLLSRIENKD